MASRRYCDVDGAEAGRMLRRRGVDGQDERERAVMQGPPESEGYGQNWSARVGMASEWMQRYRELPSGELSDP